MFGKFWVFIGTESSMVNCFNSKPNWIIYFTNKVIIARGIYSSGLLYSVNLCYNGTGSRLMIINKGIINYTSVLIMF